MCPWLHFDCWSFDMPTASHAYIYNFVSCLFQLYRRWIRSSNLDRWSFWAWWWCWKGHRDPVWKAECAELIWIVHEREGKLSEASRDLITSCQSMNAVFDIRKTLHREFYWCSVGKKKLLRWREGPRFRLQLSFRDGIHDTILAQLFSHPIRISGQIQQGSWCYCDSDTDYNASVSNYFVLSYQTCNARIQRAG